MSETVFTYGAPALKFGAGASAEIGHDLLQYGARRVLLVTDPGVAATGHPARIADQMADRGLDVTTYDGVHVEPTDESHGRRDRVRPRRRARSTRSSRSAAARRSTPRKAVNLLLTNPGELMDYVNAPVGKAHGAASTPLLPLVAVPTTTGTGSESTTICVLDVLSLKVKTGISHPALRPTLAVVDPDADRDPAGDGHRRGRDGHPLPRAGELHRALVRRLRRQAARAAGALLRRQPDRRHVVGEGAVAARRRVPGRPSATASDAAAREQMAMAATFAGLGFGNAGVHIPHANAYPIAGPGPRLPAGGLPRRRADRAARDGGLADRAGGVPVHVRRRARAAPARRPAARPRLPRPTARTRCRPCCSR